MLPSPTSTASRRPARSRCLKAARRRKPAHHRQAPRASSPRRGDGDELSRSGRLLRPAVLRGVRRSLDAPPARARPEPPARQDLARSEEEPRERADGDGGGFISRWPRHSALGVRGDGDRAALGRAGRLSRDLGALPERLRSRNPVRRERAAGHPRRRARRSPRRNGPAPSSSTIERLEIADDASRHRLRAQAQGRPRRARRASSCATARRRAAA